MNSTLTELLDQSEAYVRDFYDVSPAGEMTPIFIAKKEDGLQILLAPWGSESEKLAALQYLRTGFKEEGITAYASLTEAWMSEAAVTSNVAPSQAGDRIECVVISASDKDDTIGRVLQIVRNDNGHVVDLVSKGSKEVVIGGRLTELLKEKLTYL